MAVLKQNRFGQFLKTVSDHRCFTTMVIQDICPTNIDHGWRRMNENGVSIMSIQIRTYTGIDRSQTSYVLLKRNKSSRIGSTVLSPHHQLQLSVHLQMMYNRMQESMPHQRLLPACRLFQME
jgi:galactose-1-phosphate uridylyltransferase